MARELLALLAQGAQGIDLSGIIIAVIAAIGGGLLTTLLTLGSTRRTAESSAKVAVAEMHAKAVESIDKVRQALEHRLDEAERELRETREELARANARISELTMQSEMNKTERDRLAAELLAERQRLQGRVEELEREVTVLREAVKRPPPAGE